MTDTIHEIRNDLDDLVRDFASALRFKLEKAEEKYDWAGAWRKNDWAPALRRKLREHVEKGDPLDAAAYCAFAKWHGWSLAQPACEADVAAEDVATRAVGEIFFGNENMPRDDMGDGNVQQTVQGIIAAFTRYLLEERGRGLAESLEEIADLEGKLRAAREMAEINRQAWKAEEAYADNLRRENADLKNAMEGR